MSRSLFRRPLLAALPLAAALAGRPVRAEGELLKVQKHIFTTGDFKLLSGTVMPEVTIAYETYGTLAPDGRNAVLLTHGYTSSQHMAGRYGEKDGAEGSWNGLVGPGKAIDTDRLFVVSSNMLGSSYGSTNPAFTNPATGKPYGPDFPDITLVDIVNAQKALLDHLGVKHLVAVAGPSFGGYQTYQWGVSYPDFMDGLVPVVSAPKGSGGEAAVKSLVDALAKDPNWNGGWYYDKGGVSGILTEMRVGDAQALRHRRAAGREVSRQGRARSRDQEARRELGQGLRCQLAGRAAQGLGALRCRKGHGQDQGQGALRAVTHRQALPAHYRAGRHGQAEGGRRQRRLFRDRQRLGPLRLGPRRRQVGAAAQGVHGDTGEAQLGRVNPSCE
jgi:pimeloyl-ACP methyl ester carboxylesterase